ncbi:MAG: hypothetical protein AAGM67_01580, partial [Bacteroidota bacterium]
RRGNSFGSSGKRRDRDSDNGGDSRPSKRALQCVLLARDIPNNQGSSGVAWSMSQTHGNSKRRKIIVDTGATRHSLPSDDPDITTRAEANVEITLADGTKDHITSKGEAEINLQSTGRDKRRTSIKLSEVLLVDRNSPHGLFSVPKAVNAGCTVLFKKTHATLRTPDGFIISLQRDSKTGLFLLRDDEE